MNSDVPSPNAYDLVAYPSYTHPQTHPARLGVIGELFGLSPARADRCRVLELGCGNGCNLVPMAEGLPGSEFVGIDLAPRPIAQGQRMIAELGLRNIRLVAGSVAEITAEWGNFDYIIAHGLYSWVPPGVRPEILRQCRARLQPNGLAYISYNALPGCHQRLMVREMMLFHIRALTDPEERIQQSLALAQFLTAGLNANDEYQMLMKAELERVLEHDPGHIFHDEISEWNEPFYFSQFVQQAGDQGLQYVGEADYFEMFAQGFPESTRASLAQMGASRLLREQYLDFLKCRRFRQTLLCHHELSLKPEPAANSVFNFLVSCPARCDGEKSAASLGKIWTYKGPKGSGCSTDFALGQAALSRLEECWPAPVPFAGLLQFAQENLAMAGFPTLPEAESGPALAAFLLQLFGVGVVEFRTCLPPMATAAGDRPVASSVARWQARQGDVVASRFHTAVKVEDEIGRFLLAALDGSLDRAALAANIRQLIKPETGPGLSDQEEAVLMARIRADLEKNLAKLARLGLLVK